ncbi:MAG: hypothetical protein AABX33_02195 [Nanoarchaeota archaeon]
MKNTLQALKYLLIIILVNLLILFIFANTEGPKDGEEQVKDLIHLNEYKLDKYLVKEYFLDIITPGGANNLKRHGYFLVYSIEQDENLGNNIIIPESIFYSKVIMNIFNPITEINNDIFNENFLLFSDDYNIAQQIFDEEVTRSILELQEEKILIGTPVINSIITNEKEIQIRIFRANTRERINIETFLKNYYLSMEQKFKIVNLLVHMVANLKNEKIPSDSNVEVTYIYDAP